MKNIIYILFAISFLFTACGKEDDLTPSFAKENYFAADADATDDESILRLDFYKKNESYLLFNDTLRKEYYGVNIYNEPQYHIELLDISYVMTGSAVSYTYKYDYLNEMTEKEEAVDFVEDNILPYLSKALTPFSFLLIDAITEYEVSDRNLWYNDSPLYVVGKRSLAIAMGSLAYLDEAGKEDLRISVLSGIISDKLKGRPDEEMLAFTRYGESTYGQYMADYPADEDENMILLNEAGYIEAYFYYFTWLGRYPAKAADIAAFTKLVLREKEEDVLKTYESYPIVISKYYALKSIITDLGFKF